LNKTIIGTQTNGAGLVAVDNNNLIGSYYRKLININISGSTPIYTDIATLPDFGGDPYVSISGDILLTSTGKLLCTTNNGIGETRLLQYSYPSMTLEVVVDLYPTILGPFGLTEHNGNIYIFDISFANKLYLVSTTYPYTLTQVETLTNQVMGSSIYTSCATSNLITTTTTTTIV